MLVTTLKVPHEIMAEGAVEALIEHLHDLTHLKVAML